MCLGATNIDTDEKKEEKKVKGKRVISDKDRRKTKGKTDYGVRLRKQILDSMIP